MHSLAIRNAKTFLHIWQTCMERGEPSCPRGEETLELCDFQFTISPQYPFMTFRDRKYSVDYFKKEMLWKLGADKFDDSIKQHAKMWESVQNPDGSFNSNYGQYWFGEQNGFETAMKILVRDKDSRRALIPMLNHTHMTPETKDTVCTMGIGFRIRDDELHMSVYMRSSDQVFGLGTDLPTFSCLYSMAYVYLKAFYPNLTIGDMCVTAISSHIYARHYEMINRVLAAGEASYQLVTMPWPASIHEVDWLVNTKGKYFAEEVPPTYLLAKWLIGA